MRIEVAVLFGSCVAFAGAPAWSQVPGQPPPGAPGAPAASVPGAPAPAVPGVPAPGVSGAPVSSAAPPVVPPPAPPPSDPGPSPPVVAASALPPSPPPSAPLAAPPAAAPPAEKPIELARRFGFGFGLWASPLALVGGKSGLGPSVSYGGALSVVWWASDRVLVAPTLRMGISYTTAPDSASIYGQTVRGSSYTNGTFAPALSLGFAAYRGKSSRFILLGGLGFNYLVDENIVATPLANGGAEYKYVPVESVSFTVPAGFAFEQFFTPKISLSLGAGASLFSYGYSKTGHDAPSRVVGADFSTAQLNGSIYFYTD